MIQPIEQELIIRDFSVSIAGIYGDLLSEIILYGSYARGDFRDDSDVDFMIILDKKDIDYGEEIARMTKAVHTLMMKHNMVFSYLPIPLERWTNERSFFFDYVKKEGIPIWTKELSVS